MVGMGDGKMGVGRRSRCRDADASHADARGRERRCRTPRRPGGAHRRGHNGGDQRWGTDEMSGGGGIWQWGQRWGSAVGDG